MTRSGAGLMASAPLGPAAAVAGVCQPVAGQAVHQALDLGQGERDQIGPGWLPGVFGGRDGGEEGVREHGQGGPAVPGREGADLMLVQAAQALAGLESLLNRPPLMPVR